MILMTMGFFAKIIRESKILIFKEILLDNNINKVISNYVRTKISDLVSHYFCRHLTTSRNIIE